MNIDINHECRRKPAFSVVHRLRESGRRDDGQRSGLFSFILLKVPYFDIISRKKGMGMDHMRWGSCKSTVE